MTEARLRHVFRLSLWLKAGHSLLEVLGGAALAAMSHDRVVQVAEALTRAELIEDPRDPVANFVRSAAEGLTVGDQSFAAWYLFGHGAIKLVLVAGVLADRIWAYPAFIATMLGFIVYQAYRLSLGVTVVLVAVTVLDLVVLVLAWHEYRFARRERQRTNVRRSRAR